MPNYYDDLILNIEQCIQLNDYKQAKKLIDEELSMPYTPKTTLDKLNQLDNQVKQLLMPEKKQTLKSEEEILNDLLSGSEKAMSALEALAISNVRNYLLIIKELLSSDKINHLLKCLILEILIDQKVEDKIDFKKENTTIQIEPSKLDKVFERESFNLIANKIEQITFKNPSFTKQCIMILTNVMYDLYPNDIQEKEYEKYCFSIIKYVYQAYDNLDEFNKLVELLKIDTNNLIDFHF